MDIRAGEVLAALSFALDLTEGQPKGHCIRCCHIGMAIGRRLNLSRADLSDLFYTLLLKDLGCSSNAARICALYLTDDHRFKREFKKLDGSHLGLLRFAFENVGLHAGVVGQLGLVVRGLLDSGEASRALMETRCQRGAQIALSLGFSDEVADGIRNLDEKWDGMGLPNGRTREEIPILSRIALIAQVCDVVHTGGGPDMARSEVLSRAGTWFDPDVTQAFEDVSDDPAFWKDLRSPDLQQRILALEPALERRFVDEAYLDDVADAFAQVIDAKSPYTAGHSVRVAEIADAIAAQLGYSLPKRRWLRRAALLHDIGKLGISNAILDKPTKLTADEIEAIHKHPGLSRAILGKVAVFADMLDVVGNHHERLDGCGYPLGLTGGQICLDARIVTVADVFEALTAERPYRHSLGTEASLAVLKELSEGQVDRTCYNALTTALQHDPSLAHSADHARAMA